jgi:hypothetical protein
MPLHVNRRSTAGFAISLLTFCVIGSAALAAGAPTESSRDDKSTPQLTVRVYSFARLSPWLLQTSEIQAARLLRDLPVGLNWVNCTSRFALAVCMSNLAPTDLAVRVLAKALPQASTDALGIAGSKGGEAVAFVFYDRMVALRTQANSLASIVGRVLAHEIVHVLLPGEGHSDFGLMRGQWSTDDLRTDSSACMGLPVTSLLLMKTEALRRVVRARNLALK